MTWALHTSGLMLSGLTQSKYGECPGLAPNALTVGSKRIGFPLATNANKCLVLLSATGMASASAGKLTAYSAWVSTDVNPSAAVGLITDGTQGSSSRILRVGTDGKFTINSAAGTLLATSSATISTTAAQPTQLVFIIDPLTQGTVYCWLYVNGSEDIFCRTDLTPTDFFGNAAQDYHFFGDWCPAGSNFGCTLQAQHVVGRVSSSASDSPYLVQYPRLVAVGGMDLPPTSEGDAAAWPNGNTASPNTYQDVDETGGANSLDNGSADDRIYDSQADPATRRKHLFHYSAANPLAGTETIDWVQFRDISRLAASGKVGSNKLIKLAGTESDLTRNWGETSSYTGNGVAMTTAPGGGAWATTDFDLSGGTSKVQFGAYSNVLSGARTDDLIALMCGPEIIYHTASLPLGTTPNTRRRSGQII